MKDLASRPRLRGGWFVRPEEYKAMGYTLGLPPGFYCPQTPAIQALSLSLESQDGIILPSKIPARSGDSDHRRVFVEGIPFGMAESDLANFLSNQLYSQKRVTDPSSVENVMVMDGQFSAVVDFKTRKAAEAAVSLSRSITLEGNPLRIGWNVQKCTQESLPTATSTTDIVVESINPLPDDSVFHELLDPLGTAIEIGRVEGFNVVYVTIAKHLADRANLLLNQSGMTAHICNSPFTQRSNHLCNEGPTRLLSVLTPRIQKDLSFVNVFDMNQSITTTVHIETEHVEPIGGYRTLCLFNIAPKESLTDNDVWHEIEEDIIEQCNEFGKVEDINVSELPLATLPSDFAVVRVLFASPEDARDAQLGLAGLRYNGRIVITCLDT